MTPKITASLFTRALKVTATAPFFAESAHTLSSYCKGFGETKIPAHPIPQLMTLDKMVVAASKMSISD